MQLGYKQSIGGSDAYHYGKAAEADRKFIRVVAGAALPILDRVSGAIVVLGEIYRASGPASYIGLSACAGPWPLVENALAQYRRDLKFTHVIVDRKEAREVLWRMRGLNYAIDEIPLVTYEAPSYAAQEIGRAHVNEMVREKRLVLDEIEADFEEEGDMGALAIKCAMSWLKENPAYYAPTRQQDRTQPSRILGMDGLE